ncbi:MarR family transcriptional regulator [uncultured Microbacterium sp.]|jgi:DNA-binding MarR family transcriptional regulator|uniref:MarR family winged helix-turn-helix transcriptional regulator n=1 Tax=uncultured Microbacterium sp. TaxID=191216 RepID=UPI0025F3BFB1|nr:MarR family transcriptional regulator [uncultured Microbacterium sp.]
MTPHDELPATDTSGAGTLAGGAPDDVSGDSGSSGDSDRSDAVHALENEFSAFAARYRVLIARHADLVSPGLLAGSFKVFGAISTREGTTMSALAELLHLDKGQLSRTVRDLEERGLVARTPDPHDRRSSLLALTPEGRERLEAARRTSRGLMQVIEDWPVDDIREFTRLVRALSDAF